MMRGLTAFLFLAACTKGGTGDDTNTGDSTPDETDVVDTEVSDTERDTDRQPTCMDFDPRTECAQHEECKVVRGTLVESDEIGGFCIGAEEAAFVCVNRTIDCGEAGWGALDSRPDDCYYFRLGCTPRGDAWQECPVDHQVTDQCPA